MKVVAIAEPLGALGLIFGVLVDWAALGLAVIMVGAISMKIALWGGSFTGQGGWEFDLILLAANVVLVMRGAGAIAVPRLFKRTVTA